MSELDGGVPCPQMRKAALPGGPDRDFIPTEPAENTETASSVQARSLRKRYALGYYLALIIAPLIWGLPR